MKSKVYRFLAVVLCLALVSLACERTGKQITEKIKEGMDDPSGCDLTDQLKITTKIDQEETDPDGSYRCNYTVTFSNADPDINANIMYKSSHKDCYQDIDETRWKSLTGWGVFNISTVGGYYKTLDEDCEGGVGFTDPEKAAMIRLTDECKKIIDDETYLEIFARDIDYPCQYPLDGE